MRFCSPLLPLQPAGHHKDVQCSTHMEKFVLSTSALLLIILVYMTLNLPFASFRPFGKILIKTIWHKYDVLYRA